MLHHRQPKQQQNNAISIGESKLKLPMQWMRISRVQSYISAKVRDLKDLFIPMFLTLESYVDRGRHSVQISVAHGLEELDLRLEDLADYTFRT